jgi:hypothetical protein
MTAYPWLQAMPKAAIRLWIPKALGGESLSLKLAENS